MFNVLFRVVCTFLAGVPLFLLFFGEGSIYAFLFEGLLRPVSFFSEFCSVWHRVRMEVYCIVEDRSGFIVFLPSLS